MIDLTGLQAIANSYMNTPVTIKHRADPALDPGDRTGDNTITYLPGLTQTVGWFVDQGTRSIDRLGAMSGVVDKPTLRVPVGTDIKTRDKVQINGDWWTVTDASTDDTWPVMLKCGLVRIE